MFDLFIPEPFSQQTCENQEVTQVSPQFQRQKKLHSVLAPSYLSEEGYVLYQRASPNNPPGGGDDFMSSVNGQPINTKFRKTVASMSLYSDEKLLKTLRSPFDLNVMMLTYSESNLISQMAEAGFVSDAQYAMIEAVSKEKKAAIYAIDQYLNHFMEGNGETLHDVDYGGLLSGLVRETSVAKDIMGRITEEFTEKMSLHKGDYTKIQLKHLDLPNFTIASSGVTLYGFIGGTQEIVVRLQNIKYSFPFWTAMINVELRDDFGVSEDDITKHYSKGFIKSKLYAPASEALESFYTLQRVRGKRPFQTVYNFSFTVQGILYTP